MKKIVNAVLALGCLSASDVARFEIGRPLDKDQIPSGVSQSARFEVRENWGGGFNVNFNEFAPSSDSMEIAYFSDSETTPQGKALFFDSSFKPGIEVGFVLNTPYDHWNFAGDYLWFQGSEHLTKSGSYYYSPIFSLDPFDLLITSLHSSWHLNINVADLYITRPYYSSRRLTVSPAVGLRGTWIKQHFDLSANVTGASWSTQTVSSKSISWGVGPRVGVETNYLLGWGLNFTGGLSTSMLYSTYTKVNVEYDNALGNSAFAKNNGYNLIQPIIDSNIGFSFGTYAWEKSFYVNLSATYNFAVFFSQNMSRALVSTATSTQAVPANLYLQGVSLGLAFVF